MHFEIAKKKLESIGQEQLLSEWSHLSDAQKTALSTQIHALDIGQFHKQQKLILGGKKIFSTFDVFTDFEISGKQEDLERGLECMKAGKVGCLLVAGGEASRLKIEGAKGMVPISVVKNKTLFQLFAEKVAAASRQVEQLLPLAIMTSPSNDEEIQLFFKKNQYFGLNSKQISFFSQKTLPFLNKSGNLFLEQPDLIAAAPDGNGSALLNLLESETWESWKQRGIEFVTFILVDNPLADPFDGNLIGFHARHQNAITIKCTQRENPEEKVGIVVKRQEKVEVVEYTEIAERERQAKNLEGALKHSLANLSLFCFSTAFLEDLYSKGTFAQLPLHCMWKPVKGKTEAWKFEKFIFDLLPFAQRVQALVYPRAQVFAPLKNATPPYDRAHVQKALQERDRLTYFQISGRVPPERPFELAQDFYYPTDKMRAKWKDQSLPDADYIEI